MTRKSNGTPYRSGTEREFDLMMAARKASNGKRPAILFYKRDDPHTFARNLGKAVVTSEEAGEEMIQQLRLAKDFIREQFQDNQGHNVGAYISYEKPFAFSNRLRIHLKQVIDSILENDGLGQSVMWTGAPYRGLESFEAGDAAIFHGRDVEIQQVVERLAIREENEACAFVVVVGASGSGKSSLVKAGVVPAHTYLNEDSFGTSWRVVLFVPGLGIAPEGGSLFERFAKVLAAQEQSTLFEGLSEIVQQVSGEQVLAAYLRNDPQTAVTLVIRPALAAASAAASKTVKLLVIVDQMEEIFADVRISSDDRAAFIRLLGILSRTDVVRVVATLRSDYLAAALLNEEFISLKGIAGQFDLLAPKTAALRSMIVEPARQAGLHFDRNKHGYTLADTLLNDASGVQDALPLLEYVLRELYEHRTTNKLTFESYAEIGGLHGAIGLLAEKMIESLPVETQAAMGSVFWQLVSLDGEGAPVRRRATYPSNSDSTPTARLIRSLVDSRFATAHKNEKGQPSIILTHDYLFDAWPRLREWVQNNRRLVGFLRRVEAQSQVWDEEGRKKDYLLTPGEQISQATVLLETLPVVVDSVVYAFVQESSKQAISSERSGSLLKHDLFSCFFLARDAVQYVEEHLTKKPEELDGTTQSRMLERLFDVQIAIRMAQEKVFRSTFAGVSKRTRPTTRVALADVLKLEKRLWERFAKLEAGCSIQIDMESIRQIPRMHFDEDNFRSAFYQVVMNAIKATGSRRPNPGNEPVTAQLVIQGRQSKENYCLDVVDFGIGFPESEVSSVFSNGFRGELAKRAWMGEGRGLWMARTIMESFGGSLVVSSRRNPTVLSFIFPRALSYRPDNDSN